VLHEKLRPNRASAYLQRPENHALGIDRVTFVRRMFDDAMVQLSAYAKVRPPVAALRREIDAGVDHLSRGELDKRARAVQTAMESALKRSELSGPVYEDLILLKSLHGRYRQRLDELDRRDGAAE
jgi:hypothetical protein